MEQVEPSGRRTNCGKEGAGCSVSAHAHSRTPVPLRISAQLVCGHARLAQGGSECQEAAATSMQRTKSCLSWAERLRHSSVQQAQRQNENASPQGNSVCAEASPRPAAARRRSHPAQAAEVSDVCHLMAVLTNQLPIQPPARCWGKRKQRDRWEEVQVM